MVGEEYNEEGLMIRVEWRKPQLGNDIFNGTRILDTAQMPSLAAIETIEFNRGSNTHLC